MQFSEATLRALDGWIRVDTWSSGHPLDQQRFYKFVHQLGRDRAYLVDTESLLEFIKERKEEQGKPLNAYLLKEVERKLDLLDRIFDYLRYINLGD